MPNPIARAWDRFWSRLYDFAENAEIGVIDDDTDD